VLAPPKPPQDDPELLIEEARERQRRRRILGVAGIAMAAALALGIYAVASGGSPGSRTGDSPHRSAGAPLCRSAQLSASADFRHQGGLPSIFGGVMISDTSSSICSLPRHRPVVLLSAGGRQVPIKEHASPRLADRNTVPLMWPGAFAEVYVLWGNWCAKPASALTLEFGHGVQVTARLHTQPSCSNPGGSSNILISSTTTRS
jgi:hypothetical protein